MPIRIDRNIKKIDERDFHQIDYEITGFAFAIHNEIGRLWNEKIYQNELANRCRKAGFANVDTEVPLVVSYRDFRREYKIDLLIQDSVVYELKSVNKLSPEHEKQALNYLLLLGLQHGKLINFRPVSVEKRFVSTTLLPDDRYGIVFDAAHWSALSEECLRLRELIVELLKDWGAYLETKLYYDAICHFQGGENQVAKNIDVFHNGLKIGSQKIHLLTQNVAFKLTAVTKNIQNYHRHLNRFMRFTNLDGIQWVNFNHNVISFKTISNQ